MRVAVIGAGPAGLTAAYELSKSGIEVDVFEAGSEVGGMAKTISLWGQKADLGPHRFFSNDSRVNRLWLEVVGNDYAIVDRLTRIYYKNKFFLYPLKPLNALSNLGIGQAALCFFSYFKERMFPTRQDGSFESWVIGRFGKRLFGIFFKTYSEKLWGISCSELDNDFAAQRIKKLSLSEAIRNAFYAPKISKHKTLADQFAYPKGGTGMVYERMEKYINSHKGKVHCATAIKKIVTEGKKTVGVELADGLIRQYDRVISSMPISSLMKGLPDVPAPVKEAAESLKFRNTILVYLNVQCEQLFRDNWLYIHSPDLKTGRITNFRNWVPELYGKEKSSIIAMEYWCYDNDDIWTAKEEDLVELGKQELRKTGLIKQSEISDGFVYRIKRCYPVYELNYRKKLKIIEDHLSAIQNLSVIGRYGAFKYNNQDHSILMGLLAAENIIKGTHHNLWEINTDYDDYQERSIITQTGLKNIEV